MMNITTARKTREQRNARIAWASAALLFTLLGVLLYTNDSLRQSILDFSREESEQYAEIRKEMKPMLQKLEKHRLEQTKLKKEEAEKLRKASELKHKKNMIRKVEELREINRELTKERELREKKIKARTQEQMRKQELEDIKLVKNQLDDSWKLFEKKNQSKKHLGKEKLDYLDEARNELQTAMDEALEDPLNDEALENLEEKAEEFSERMAKALDDKSTTFDRQGEEAKNAAERIAEIAENTQQFGEDMDAFNDIPDPLEDEEEIDSEKDDPKNELYADISDGASSSDSNSGSNENGDDSESDSEAHGSGSSATPSATAVAAAMEGELGSKTPDELVETANVLENHANAQFNAARTADMAMATNSSFAEAKDKLAKDESAQSGSESGSLAQQGSGIGTAQDFQDYDKALENAVREVGQKVSKANNQLSQMSSNSQQGMGQLSSQQAAQISSATQSAINNVHRQPNQIIDLSGLMRPNVIGEITMSSGGSSNSIPGEGGARIDENIEDGGAHMVETSSVPKTLKSEAVLNTLPGRRFSEESTRKGWLYLDTWYIIGPWDNKGKIDYEVKHPPETIIDLDGVYQGKVYSNWQMKADRKRGIERDHIVGQPRQLKWQFTQGDTVRITPPDDQSDSTYYAYTDVFFDEPREMLINVATDDAAKVWINGIVVQEEKGLSPYSLGENYRKVFLHQGYNRILLRIENGPKVCRFSMVMVPPEAISKS